MKRETPEFTEENVIELIDESDDGKTIEQVRRLFLTNLEETKLMLLELINKKKVLEGNYVSCRRRYFTYKEIKEKVAPPHRNAFTPEMSIGYGLRLRELLEARR
jgi:hypothetical protein